MPGSDRVDLYEVIAHCRAAHQRLFDTISPLTDAEVARPSGLPGWTVGHVLTHLARNADSHVRMLEAAARGEAVEQYPGGYAQRAADIEAGAGRRAAAIRHDVTTAAGALERTWDGMSTEAWDGHGLARGSPWPCREMPYHRWREVEIHHADLALGYGPGDWPEDYVRLELARTVVSLPERIAAPGDRRRLLAWLLGRADQPHRLTLAEWESASDHYFAGGD